MRKQARRLSNSKRNHKDAQLAGMLGASFFCDKSE